MFNDARTLEPGARLEADVCIVGGGAAGLTVARGLRGAKARVIVLESGGLTADKKAKRLTAGHAAGWLLRRRKSRYLMSSRERRVGGLANSWHGACRTLDPEDFAVRDWVPDSGWPLAREALEPYYERARRLLGLETPELESTDPPAGELLTDDTRFGSSWVAYAARGALGRTWRRRVAEGSNVEVFTHATVSALELDSAGGQVESATVRCLDGPSFEVQARHFVLAAGALENSRLLLASNSRRSAGLGNAHDLVGRYFMDQPMLRAGYVTLPGSADAMAAYARPQARPARRAIMRPSVSFQERHELLNSMVMIEPATSDDCGPLAPDVERFAADLRRLAGGNAVEPSYFGAVLLRGEQRPHRDSRLVLSAQRDALGMPQIDLDWQVSEHDRWSLTTTARLLGESFGRRALGRMQLRLGSGRRRAMTWSGYQSGTTRMSHEPARGVVNPNCRVHDLPNLFLAGSSVFPTSGCSGPIMTTIALALRLGDNLRRLLGA